MTNLKSRVMKLENQDGDPDRLVVVGGMQDRANIQPGKPFCWYTMMPARKAKRLGEIRAAQLRDIEDKK